MSFFPPAPRGRGAPRGNGHIHGFHPYGRGRGRGFGYDEYQAPAPPPTPLAAKPAKLKPVEINGIKFRLILNGSKLKRITPFSDDLPTPMKHQMGPIMFYRTKGGNLLRKKEYLELQAKLVTRKTPCAHFTRTGTPHHQV